MNAPKLRGWRKGPIRIRCWDAERGRVVNRQITDALVRGRFSIHFTLGGYWVLTHMRTGAAIQTSHAPPPLARLASMLARRPRFWDRLKTKVVDGVVKQVGTSKRDFAWATNCIWKAFGGDRFPPERLDESYAIHVIGGEQ